MILVKISILNPRQLTFVSDWKTSESVSGSYSILHQWLLPDRQHRMDGPVHSRSEERYSLSQ